MKKKDSCSRKFFNVFNICFFLCLIVVTLFPYVNVMAKAFNDGKDTMRGGIVLWPRVPTLENFEAVLKDEAFLRALLLTLSITFLGTLVKLSVQYMTAYVFLNKNLMGRNFLMYYLMIPMYLGGGIIPTYILYSHLGLMNNYLVYILPGCFSMYNMVIIRTYLTTISQSLPEAAKIDGANDFTIAFKVMLPLAKPVLATVGLWLAVGHWTSWAVTLYYVTDKRLYTLQYILMQVLKEAQKIQTLISEAQLRGEFLNIQSSVTTDSIRCAQIIVTTIPIIAVYPFVQKYFIQGVMLGAVKD